MPGFESVDATDLPLPFEDEEGGGFFIVEDWCNITMQYALG
jgi:hypothetical protein